MAHGLKLKGDAEIDALRLGHLRVRPAQLVGQDLDAEGDGVELVVQRRDLELLVLTRREPFELLEKLHHAGAGERQFPGCAHR
jgi:hypothetical protein